VLSKKGTTKVSKEVLKNWKKLDSDEIDSWITQNFEDIWAKYDSSGE